MKCGRPRRTCRRLKNTNLAIFDTVIDRVHEFRLYSIGLVRVMEVPLRDIHGVMMHYAVQEVLVLATLSMKYECSTIFVIFQVATCGRRVT